MMRAPSPGTLDLAVAIVTYGSREKVCLETLTRVAACRPALIVLVCNGCSAEAMRSYFRKGVENGWPLVVIERPTNGGSAIGFWRALQFLATIEPNVLILDDDNWPEDGAIELAFRTMTQSGTDGTAYLLYRPYNMLQSRYVAAGGDYAFHPARPGAFDYEDRFAPSWRTSPTRSDGLLVPNGPWSGLMLRASLWPSLPRVRLSFETYKEDVDFTQRLTALGVELLLLTHCQILDADRAGLIVVDVRDGGVTTGDLRRAYLSARNGVVVDWERCRSLTEAMSFACNGAIQFARVGRGCVARHDDRRMLARAHLRGYLAGVIRVLSRTL